MKGLIQSMCLNYQSILYYFIIVDCLIVYSGLYDVSFFLSFSFTPLPRVLLMQ